MKVDEPVPDHVGDEVAAPDEEEGKRAAKQESEENLWLECVGAS